MEEDDPIIINLNNEIKLLNVVMDKADKWYNDNKNDIHCSYIEAVELYRMGIDCRFMKPNQ